MRPCAGRPGGSSQIASPCSLPLAADPNASMMSPKWHRSTPSTKPGRSLRPHRRQGASRGGRRQREGRLPHFRGTALRVSCSCNGSDDEPADWKPPRLGPTPDPPLRSLDRQKPMPPPMPPISSPPPWPAGAAFSGLSAMTTCLLYTSDAADDLLCVDLGG